MKLLLPFFALLLATFPVLAEELPTAMRAALRDAGIPLQSVSVVVQAVDAPQPVLALNPSLAMNPASTMKLVTTYAGLELLGPAFTWTTEALTDIPIRNGRLAGNLYLRGSGDPKLSLEAFWLLLRQLRARGLTEIAGDLIVDRSAFALPAHDPAAFDNEPLRPYNAGPDALLLNLNSIHLTLQANSEARRVTLINETPGDGVRLINRLRLSEEACGDWREKLAIAVSGDTLTLTGVFPAGCDEKALNLSPWAPDVQVERLFRTLWQEMGGTWRGRLRTGLTPAGAQRLATEESPPLADVVRDVNKYSNNVMARQIFLTLASERPATPAAARQRVGNWLADKGVDTSGLILDNGSGLSRSERVSATTLAQLLQAAWQSPVMPELMASLPLAGVDGTLKRRLGDSPATGRAHLKTGYLDGVRAIAGYVLDRSGRRWITVCLINDPQARQGKPAIDALLGWVAAH
ncbi:D-alanyl-D-alanine carboxypeptidase/D-alanyl-D-alanine-endopeptidase [Rhodocyclus tenuis]|uniref:D-alanyl-D-alanine carboxypeptidase/D-alanyl-D-alanine-endopeptidase n=1 Tax=Rhodocyclus gracilis TaxID=2929842 RepID=A0ABX0WGY1_9RHOO|nr:D-alanyl-D-alanine carboxypeptidase/D-alanyl-D-alanine-endopeptidase [Rhodocyclus gracilis]NJA88610.1 D-alanyl-D-alanine carboxypeptidase/D-alanyl-D-alanine-endopeptidase [Rhodocyclus gracilis]